MLRKLIVSALFVAVCATAAAVATDKYHTLAVAEKASYDRFVDTNGVACIAMDDMPDMGAMGFHYVKGPLVGDGAVDPLTPEALVYAPDQAGQMHLAALEYLVLQDAWDATHTAPPSLFGQQFSLTTSPNRYGLANFYSLHAWLWQHNPAGTFAMWNPDVNCAVGHDHAGTSLPRLGPR
jgi:hypothetical protein